MSAEVDAPPSERDWSDALRFWRSPIDQPTWARPILLCITALAGLAYAWRIDQASLEPFYGGAARSMAQSLHNFIYGAADPFGTVTVDKLPGSLWVEAIFIRILGFHVWALALPQVIEGMLTILVLYRVVRRVAGPRAGLVAAVVMAGTPIVILLNRGNIADSLLILLLVLAADATVRAFQSGRLRSLVWAGVLVGFAFQAKMLEAWLVIPALFLAYLVAAPVASFFRRIWHLAVAGVVTVVVSLSWISAVSLVPQSSRPYVDGSCNDSLFDQVFRYNGFSRVSYNITNVHGGCIRPSAWSQALAAYSTREGTTTFNIGPSWFRLLHGPFGRDVAWLLLPAAVSAVWIFLLDWRAPRTDSRRASVILWSGWLAFTYASFSRGHFLNSYYLAAMVPPIAALCGMGAAEAWQRRQVPSVRAAVAGLTVATVGVSLALVPENVGVRPWIIGSGVAIGLVAVAVIANSLRHGHNSSRAVSAGPALAALSMLLGSFWASAVVVSAQLGPFATPYASASVNAYSQKVSSEFPATQQRLARADARVPPGRAVDVLETSETTGAYILATGREYLPVGGFGGSIPTPTLSAFEHLVAQGRIERVTVIVKPLTNEPVMRWVVHNCDAIGPKKYDPQASATSNVFDCHPGDAS